ncbi:MAG: hydantoinase B/oxoprolinase family protein [Alphaproteobacteria bacterium]|nr:hydantoinase B/oxoprolinase family protein [Alphaproteobacteria bacterium]
MDEVGKLELIREALIAVTQEMRANVIHSSYSSIIYEGHDFSTALVGPDGRYVAQCDGDHPLHVFSVPYSTRKILEEFGGDIREGDIFLHNDPYTGGTHLNDILQLHPVVHEGDIVMFAAIRYHFGDVGGMTAGSLSGEAREIFQEGLRITPTKICNAGVMNEAYLSLLFNNMRQPLERRGDFNAMYGTGRKAVEHVQRLCRRFGKKDLLEAIDEILARSETVMRSRIQALEDGDYYAEGFMESTGTSPEPLVLRLKLSVKGDRLIADYTGTSPQTAGPTNVGPAMTMTSLCTIVKSFLDPGTPVNHGSFEPIEIISPPGTFINATYPAACGGMTEVKSLLDSVGSTVMGQAVPEMMVGDLKGGANHTYVSGPDPHRNDDIYLLYEWIAGGTGASEGHDGNNGVRNYTEGDFNSVHAVEIVESQYPIAVDRFEIRAGSCGDGKWRGGFGVRRDVRVKSDVGALSVLTDKCVIPPFGVHGAKNGAGNHFVVIRDGEFLEPSAVPGKVSGFPLRREDVVREESAGGGGYGDPLERGPDLVATDVRLGYFTADQADRRYGVVLNADGSVDEPATGRRRQELGDERIHVAVQAANAEMYADAKREFVVPSDVAARLGIGEGDLVELIAGTGPLVRGWARIGDADGGAPVMVGASAFNLLKTTPGAPAEIRRVVSTPPE